MSSEFIILSDAGKALGSCRLQINDLSPSGDQPFQNADGTIHVVVNGELYDYKRIREDIVRKTDYSFKGTSDCEIVVALVSLYRASFAPLMISAHSAATATSTVL